MSRKLNILIIRNDKLGDFMLTWPALSLLKKQYPDCKVTALVPSYTEPVATFCPWIDDVIIDEQHESTISDARVLAKKIRPYSFDAAISLYTETRTALATYLSGIPVRVAPATKVAQIFSNTKLRQRRSESAKPEHEYNTDLVRFFIEQQDEEPISLQSPPFMQFNEDQTSQLRKEFFQQHKIPAESTLVIVHPGSGGSAINLSVPQYARLMTSLSKQTSIYFVITAGPGEENTAESLSREITDIKHCTYKSTLGIIAFSQFIACSDAFISGSTGTLHIAGALNVPTAAFYSARQSATALRWQTLNSENRRLAFSPNKYTGENDMQNMDVDACARKISTMLLQIYQ